jgi:LytS/YehU family sensor histidine kinase
MLSKHFRTNLQNNSFRIIQIMMEIQHPNLNFMELFFEIHDSKYL